MTPISPTPVRVSRATSLSGELRTRTRADHLGAEAALDVSTVRTPTDLVALLRAWASVWRSVEGAGQHASTCRTARTELAAPADEALSWLTSDLEDLAASGCGTGPTEPVRGDPAPGGLVGLLATPAGSWGVAYVLRGSRLGGGVLARQLGALTGLPGGGGTRFLRSAGTDPGREWVAFRGRLDVLDLAADQRSAVVAAARWTFGWVGGELAADRRLRLARA